jgi:hypothetical protein
MPQANASQVCRSVDQQSGRAVNLPSPLRANYTVEDSTATPQPIHPWSWYGTGVAYHSGSPPPVSNVRGDGQEENDDLNTAQFPVSSHVDSPTIMPFQLESPFIYSMSLDDLGNLGYLPAYHGSENVPPTNLSDLDAQASPDPLQLGNDPLLNDTSHIIPNPYIPLQSTRVQSPPTSHSPSRARSLRLAEIAERPHSAAPVLSVPYSTVFANYDNAHSHAMHRSTSTPVDDPTPSVIYRTRYPGGSWADSDISLSDEDPQVERLFPSATMSGSRGSGDRGSGRSSAPPPVPVPVPVLAPAVTENRSSRRRNYDDIVDEDMRIRATMLAAERGRQRRSDMNSIEIGTQSGGSGSTSTQEGWFPSWRARQQAGGAGDSNSSGDGGSGGSHGGGQGRVGDSRRHGIVFEEEDEAASSAIAPAGIPPSYPEGDGEGSTSSPAGATPGAARRLSNVYFPNHRYR